MEEYRLECLTWKLGCCHQEVWKSVVLIARQTGDRQTDTD